MYDDINNIHILDSRGALRWKIILPRQRVTT